MSVVNTRNALLGWAVWALAKRSAKRKLKKTVRGGAGGRRQICSIPLLLGIAATGLVAWRSHRGAGIQLADGAPPPSSNGAGESAPTVVRDATEPAAADPAPASETVAHGRAPHEFSAKSGEHRRGGSCASGTWSRVSPLRQCAERK